MFDLNKSIELSKKNTHTLITSPILAKAIIKLPNGTYQVLAVFAQSTTFQFYWSFKINNPRTPRGKWERPNHGTKLNYKNFDAFVQAILSLSRGELISKKVSKRKLASLMKKCVHDSISTDWGAVQETPTPEQFRLVNQRAQKAFKQTGFYFNTRNRELDNAPVQTSDEVLVYEDACFECMNKHAFAHYADGRKVCKLGYSEMKKNPGFIYKGYKPNVGFRFVYKSAEIIGQGVTA